MKRYWCLLLLMLCALFAYGQSKYVFTTKYQLVQNDTNCANFNCFLPTTQGGVPALVDITSDFEGNVYGVDSTGNVWTLPAYMDNGNQPQWFATGYTGATHVVQGQPGEIYRIAIPYNGCTAPNGIVQKWKNPWISMGICAKSMSISADDTLAIVKNDGSIHYTTNPQATNVAWSTLTGTGYTQVAVISSTAGYALKGNTLYLVNFTGNTATAVSGAPALNEITVDNSQYLFAIAKTAGGKGNVYQYNFGSTSPTWVNIPGTFSLISGNSHGAVFALDSNGVPNHYLSVALEAYQNINGYYDCSIIGVCPTGSVHTATTHVAFTNGYHVHTDASAYGNPADNLNVTAYDISAACDPIFGDPNSPDCLVNSSSTGDVECSVMGALAWESWSFIIPHFEIAVTETALDGIGQNCRNVGQWGLQECDYPVMNWCAANYLPPDNDYTGQKITDLAIGFVSWYTANPCISFTGGQPWACLKGRLNAWGSKSTPAKGYCTHNP